MKLQPERCAVVLVGAWNPAIFTPPWVLGKLYPNAPGRVLQTEVAFGTYPFVTSFVPTSGDHNVKLSVLPQQVQLLPLSPTDDCFREVARIARAIVDRLPETPMRGVGINFGFDLERDTFTERLFGSLEDSTSFERDGWKVGTTTLSRRLTKGDAVLNVTTTRKPPRVDFNHHVDTPTASAAEKVFASGILELKQLSIELATSVFGESL